MQPCCQDEENLGEPQATDREGFVVRVCDVCGRRHFELPADPVRVGLSGKGL